MEPSSVKEYFGVPVLVQLRFPLAGIETRAKDKGKLPYAADPNLSQWVPIAHMVNDSPSGTQLMQCAVLYPVNDGSSTVVEMRWSSIPAEPSPEQIRAGAIMGSVAVLATLLDAKDIVAITRVVSVTEPSSLILKA